MLVEQALMMSPLAWLALKSVAWLALVSLAVLCARRASAAAKAGIWATGLIGLLLLPPLAQVLPSWELTASREPIETAGIPAPPRPPEASFTQVQINALAPAPAATRPAQSALAAATDRDAGVLSMSSGALLIWAMGAAWLLVRLYRAWRATVRLAAAAGPTSNVRLLTCMDRARQRLGLRRRITLRLSDTLAVPVTFGLWQPQVLLPRAASEWPERRLMHVLAHELAHVRRHDWAVQLAGSAVRALYWFNPLAWIAFGAWRRQAELASDDQVIDHGVPPGDYASDLVAVARALRERLHPTATCVAMARRSDLAERVEALLDDRRQRGALRAPGSAAGLIVGLTVGLPLSALTLVESPTATVDPARASPDRVLVAEAGPAERREQTSQRTRMTYQDDDFRLQLRREDDWLEVSWSDGNEQVQLRLEGSIELSDDERGIQHITPGGLFSLEERRGRNRRAVTLTPDAGGRPAQRYLVNGKVADWDSAASQWFAETLLQVLRYSGLNGEARVQRLLARGGTAAVLEEVRQLYLSQVAADYLTYLLSSTSLTIQEASELLAVAGERVTSDHALAGVLMRLTDQMGLPAPLHLPYLQAVSSIASDHEAGRVLARLLQEPLDESALMTVLEVTGTIASDHEAATVLKQIPERYALSAEARAAYLANVAQVQSDHEQSMLFIHLLRQPLSAVEFAELIRAAQSLQSDHELSMVLLAALRNQTLAGPSLDAFASTAATIASDHELASVLLAMLRQAPDDPARSLVALELLRTVSSDAEAVSVLTTVLRERPVLDEAEWSAFLQAYATIGSSNQQSSLLDVLLNNGALGEARVLDVLGLIEAIRSDSAALDALRTVVRTQPLNDRARERYREVAEGLGGNRPRQAALEALAEPPGY